jgi:uncharacterized iron-regulated membrane protein
MTSILRSIHRYVSLALAALWLMQLVTGAMLVFHWELDDGSVPGPKAALNPALMGQTLAAFQDAHPLGPVSLYASGGSPGRFDLLAVKAPGKSDAFRVDGAGQVLRQRPSDYDTVHIGVFQIATYLHQTLFAGDRGKTVIGISGLFLLSNMIIGLKLAWPRAGQWRQTLMPKRGKAPGTTLFGWHRALGLCLAPIALVLISVGVLLAFDDPLRAMLGVRDLEPSAAAEQITGAPTSPGQALRLALAQYPAASLASLTMPWTDAPWFKITLRQPGEARRIDGTTAVYISARGGRVLERIDALRAPLKVKVLDALYAVHTGEIGGLVGRMLALLIALTLLMLAGLGLGLWWRRRGTRLRASRAQP